MFFVERSNRGYFEKKKVGRLRRKPGSCMQTCSLRVVVIESTHRRIIRSVYRVVVTSAQYETLPTEEGNAVLSNSLQLHDHEQHLVFVVSIGCLRVKAL